MRKIKKYTAFFLMMIIGLSFIYPFVQLRAEDNNIYISNAKDLIDLSKKCTLDSWSYNKQIILEGDIDLTGTSFKPIPIFSGTFDGGGYTIRGLDLKENGSHQGLFRYVQEGAIIQNLNVEGSVTSGGSKTYIGSMVGRNKGLVKNCTFTGVINGAKYIGGLVGVNEPSGKLIDCKVSGIVYGEHQIGGIAGENMGTILRCTNNASVNTQAINQDINVEKIVHEGISTMKEANDLTSDISDIGGIVGVNMGIVQNCINSGIIGYEHIGYNVGGIAGRQSGYITECHNEGSVYGRKEVGGIVGQMEPYTVLTFSQSKLDELSKELDVLQNMVHKATANSHDGSDLISSQLTTIQNHVDTARNHTQSLLDQTEEMINQNVDTVNEVSTTVSEALDRLIPVANSLTDMSRYIEESIQPIQNALQYMRKVTDSTDEGIDELENITEYMHSAIGSADHALVSFNDGLNLINTSMEYLVSGDLKGVVHSIQKAMDALDRSRNELHSSLRDLEYATSHLSEVFDVLDDANHYIDKSINAMSKSMDSMENAADSLTNTFTELSSLVEYLADQPEVSFVTSDSNYQETKNNLCDALGETSNALSKLNNVFNKQSHILLNDIQAITDQLFVVFDTMLDITNEVTSFDIKSEEYKEDISNADTQEQTEGKVANCLNNGIVSGDINVGGITGAIAIERSFDPEDDIEVKGNKSLNFIFQTRAVIRECHNKGEIKAKKDGVGGIVGTMKLGYVVDSIAEGKIISNGGNYIGGIAGQSYSLIRSSYAKCVLEGGEYIGGIAGKGRDMLNCRAFVRINSADEYFGSIAGDIEGDGQIQGNFFVSDTLGGIDGISYVGKSEPLAYEDFIQLEGMPSIFSEFTLNFLADNKVVEKVPFTYGDSLDDKKLPQVPPKEGYLGTWEAFDSTHLTFDQDVEAIYTSLRSTLESKERRNDAMPIMLVDGLFTPTDVLTLRKSDHLAPRLQEDQTQLEQWSITIPDDGNKTHTLRYLVPEDTKNIQIYLLKDEKWVQVDTKQDGKYILFDMDYNHCVLSVINNPQTTLASLFIVPIVLILLLVIFIKSIHSKRTASITQSIS